MTTKEQISQAADKYTDNADTFIEYSDDGGWSDKNDIEYVEKAFSKGAEYGYKLALEKVYGWLDSIDFEQRYLDSENLFNREQFIDDLKQEMML